MKKFPYPDKPLKTDKEIEAYIGALVYNALNHLRIDGYDFYVLLPGMPDFRESVGSGACIVVEYPYKKFKVSIQQATITKAKKEKLDSPFWKNAEKSIFHECLHIILWRLSELATQRYVTPTDITNEDESVTDHLTNVIYPYVEKFRKK